MRAFKGFNKDLTCRGYQYEEGKEFHTERAECCDTGFHACEYPLDCFGYYDPAHSVPLYRGRNCRSNRRWRDRRGIIQRVVHFVRKDVPLFSILSKNPPQK